MYMVPLHWVGSFSVPCSTHVPFIYIFLPDFPYPSTKNSCQATCLFRRLQKFHWSVMLSCEAQPYGLFVFPVVVASSTAASPMFFYMVGFVYNLLSSFYLFQSSTISFCLPESFSVICNCEICQATFVHCSFSFLHTNSFPCNICDNLYFLVFAT